MNTGVLITLIGIIILLVFIIILLAVVLYLRVANLEESVAVLDLDSRKLKKVSVGNYLDVYRIKKHLGMEVGECEKDLEGDKSEES